VNEWLERRSCKDSNESRGFNSTNTDSEFQRDRARIIHSASFRSLQSKTQVLGLGESDFYRTRLTHSLEVAQIGSGICEWLRDTTDKSDTIRWIPSFNLIEAICLAHDMGHAPFGHGGEVALNYMMWSHGGFEANGQTLRILSRLGEYSTDCGLDLTRRTALGTIKYPVYFSETTNYPAGCRDLESRVNIDNWTPPKCLYDDERDVVDWILEPFSAADHARFRQIDLRDHEHHRSIYKSFDTSIMELADDIAYGVHDLEDALALGLVDQQAWLEDVDEPVRSLPDNAVSREMDFYNQALFSPSPRERKHAISKLVGYLIRHIEIREDASFEHPLLRSQAFMEESAYTILQLLKDFVMREVIMRPELQTLQYKGQQVIIRLFEIFAENPRRLLPRDVYREFAGDHAIASNGNYRAIADFICGMTDVSAGKLYHKLLSPTMGSIFDRT